MVKEVFYLADLVLEIKLFLYSEGSFPEYFLKEATNDDLLLNPQVEDIPSML